MITKEWDVTLEDSESSTIVQDTSSQLLSVDHNNSFSYVTDRDCSEQTDNTELSLCTVEGIITTTIIYNNK